MKLVFSRFSLIISIVLLFASTYFVVDIYTKMKERQAIVIDLATVNDISYGLFNLEKWKVFVADIIVKKVNELEFDANLTQTMKGPVSQALYSLIDNVEKFLTKEKEKGNFIQQIVKTVAYDMVFDAQSFKKQVPEWTNEVIRQINTVENRNQVKKYLLDQLNDYLNQTAMVKNFDVEGWLLNKYETENFKECTLNLAEKAKNLNNEAWKLSWILISTVIVMFILYFSNSSKYRTEIHYYVLFLGVITLLAGGVLTPMIDIDARLINVEMILLGEAIQFKDQVIFFQTKSVFDVVELLIKEGNIQTIGVGILIFTFSIIFPLFKFIFSILAYRLPRWVKNNMIPRFFVLESAKWSMADVMVLAIFMAYIGFSTIVGSLLPESNNNRFLSTHEHTTLQIGFFIFTAYCLCGIVFGYAAKKVLNRCDEIS